MSTSGKIKLGIGALIAGVGLLSSIFTVPPDSVGVVKRFGKYVRTTEPGIHLKIPYTVESVNKVPVTIVHKLEFGFRTLRPGVDTQYLGAEEIGIGHADEGDLVKLIKESGELVEGRDVVEKARTVLQREYLMLTGDLNMADVEFIVQYRIEDPVAYLFNIREPQHTIRDISHAVMRLIVGNGSVDEVITIGRAEYEKQAQQMVQAYLDEYKSGIRIVTVKLQSCNPPQNVRDAFNKVNEALQYKEQRINEAMTEYNTVVPKVRGEALEVVRNAEGYAVERINKAKGDAKKYEEILKEYKKAPEITRQRMYFETMSKVLPEVDKKWVIDEGAGDLGDGLLKILDLNKGEK